jgi:hypothetical protein
LITKIEISPGLQQEVRARVHGYFIYVILYTQGLEKNLHYNYLTPPDKPFEFDIPPWFFEKKTIDHVTSKDVVNQFVRLMKERVEIIPPKPIEIPWHKIPPSKRKKIISDLVQARSNEMAAEPPERFLDDGSSN